MKTVYLLRHAKSSWDDPVDDFDRPLARRGRRAARVMAEYLVKAGLRPAAVLCSPALRTRETLELLDGAVGRLPATLDKRLYEASAATLLACLQALPDDLPSVLLIGHNPGLERLTASLAGDRQDGPELARLRQKFPTGALAVLQAETEHWHDLQPGRCRLERFITPDDLEG